MDGSVTNKEQKLYDNLKPIVEPLEVELVDVEIKTHEEQPLIRVVIDTGEGVPLDKCEKVSEYISPLLELEVPELKGPYNLEVSSPGLKRRLRREEEYDKFRGRDVVINCYAPCEGRKEWQGTLGGRKNEAVLLADTPAGEILIPINKIASVRLYFDAEAALNKQEE